MPPAAPRLPERLDGVPTRLPERLDGVPTRLPERLDGVPSIPLSTYRLQFNAEFTFSDAAATVDYLHALGVSHCYASSYLKAVPGSTHGYDVADPTRLNPELGDEAARQVPKVEFNKA